MKIIMHLHSVYIIFRKAKKQFQFVAFICISHCIGSAAVRDGVHIFLYIIGNDNGKTAEENKDKKNAHGYRIHIFIRCFYNASAIHTYLYNV